MFIQNNFLLMRLKMFTCHKYHYRKICLFRAFLLCREQTHGKETFAVSRHGQPTAKLDDTAQLTTAHGEPAAHGRLRQRLTAKQATR
jgi:hypothetical protein